MTYREVVFELMVLGVIPAGLFIVFHTANTLRERGWRGLLRVAWWDSISWVVILGGVFAWYVVSILTSGNTRSRPWDTDAYVLVAWLLLMDLALWGRYIHWLWYAWKRRRASELHALLDDDRQEDR